MDITKNDTFMKFTHKFDILKQNCNKDLIYQRNFTV